MFGVPQRQGLQPELVSFKALYQAWYACQRRKAGKAAAQKYELKLLDHLWQLQQRLQNWQYQPTASYCFITTKPKLREIHAAYFGDRVVHHYLVPKLERLWEPWFIYDVYSNRKTKGTHKAVQRCQVFMRKHKAQFFLQLDIKNFFYSIDQDLLLNFIEQGLLKAQRQNKITDQQAGFYFYLCQQFITANFEKSHPLNPVLSQHLPSHKQLSQQPKGKGLPIGNLTSQFFANVYLNELDQFIKHQLKCAYYVRFVDDFILMAQTPQQLKDWQKDITVFLSTRLKLRLKAQKTLAPVTNGANFLGYIVRPHYILVRKRVISNLKQKLTCFERELRTQQGRLTLQTQKVEQIRATLASYIGHFKHAHSLKLIESIWHTYPWLHHLFWFHPASYQLEVKYAAKANVNYRQQIAHFRKAYPNAKLQVEFGKQLQTYLPLSGSFVETVKVKQQGYNQRGIRHRAVTQVIHSIH